MMTRPLILVTSAAGKTGAALVAELRARDWPVRALVHRADARSEHLRALGAEVVVGDLFDPEQVLAAMRGAKRAYFCPPWDPHMIHAAVAFAVAAREAGLEGIVGLSQWLASPSHPSLATRHNWLTDKLLAMVPGAGHVVIDPGFFADNYLRVLTFPAQLGIFPLPLGDGRNAPPSNEDIARVAAGALMDLDRHAGKTYRPTGPKVLSGQDMVEIFARVLQRRVWYTPLPDWMFRKALRALGVEPFQQTGLRHYMEEHRRGTFAIGAPNDHVREVTGREAEDFETITRRYAADPAIARTLPNFVRALGDFARIGLTPALDLDELAQRQRHPRPPRPLLAVDAPTWQATHAAHART